ncbi:hypothetical protein C6N40_02255 [Arenimonas caeni]|uniref:Uncharacterized protein n=1 Tax=Arenimonas caeni TaxID=2058085 RepID=A0A2P6MBW7_9GAMM|nr:hypothetical protein C6N40_02255 [Arenimonas caeni]
MGERFILKMPERMQSDRIVLPSRHTHLVYYHHIGFRELLVVQRKASLPFGEEVGDHRNFLRADGPLL